MNRCRSLLWPGVAALAALSTLLSLAGWQWTRKAEKEAVLAALARGLTAEPAPLDAARLAKLRVLLAGGRGEPREALPELTRVRLEGVYLPVRSVPVRATLPATRGAPASGIGFFWMTPLRLDGDAIVFINRGFVPSGTDFRPPAIATPEGRQTVVGLLRLPEKRQFFMSADDPARGEYFARDPAAMAIAAGLDPARVAPLFVDAERAAPDSATPPVGVDARELIARIPNNHLQYAVTWFGLALTLVGVFAAFARGRLKGQS